MLCRQTLILVVFLACGVAACKSQESLTAKQVGCSTRDVTIIPSEYSRAGSLTRWCAMCGNDTFVCVSNPQRDPVVCRKVEVGPPCE
jgi:hypothetical protein